MGLTASQEARYALDYQLPRESLRPEVQAEYDRLCREDQPVHIGTHTDSRSSGTMTDLTKNQQLPPPRLPTPPQRPGSIARARPGETPELTYARQTRNAVTFIAWVVAIVCATSLILGLVAAVQLSKLSSALNGSGSTSSNCMSQGGTDPSC